MGASLATGQAKCRACSPNRNGSIMAIEQIIGFAVLAQLTIGTILYSMGYRDGKSVGYMRGRAVQMAAIKSKAVK
jgi:hypothetical protein